MHQSRIGDLGASRVEPFQFPQGNGFWKMGEIFRERGLVSTGEGLAGDLPSDSSKRVQKNKKTCKEKEQDPAEGFTHLLKLHSE